MAAAKMAAAISKNGGMAASVGWRWRQWRYGGVSIISINGSIAGSGNQPAA